MPQVGNNGLIKPCFCGSVPTRPVIAQRRGKFSTKVGHAREFRFIPSEYSLNLNTEWDEFNALFEKLKKRSADIDPTLAASSDAVKTRLKTALSNLEKKFVKAEKRNHEVALRQIETVRKTYFPGNSLQERTENFGLLYTQYGDKFIAELIHHFKPLDFKFTVLEFQS